VTGVGTRITQLIVCLAAAATVSGCGARCGAARDSSDSEGARAQVTDSVRAFAAEVAHDITHDGPSAWLRYFSDAPAFFMAVNGELPFASGTQARQALPGIARQIPHIELSWGEGLRVDPLGGDLAVLAGPWREIQIDSAGHRTEEAGYFSGVVERRDGHWRFRDAHWSQPLPRPAT
jgi:hypothetical protein